MILNTLLEIIDGSNRELFPDVDMNTNTLPGRADSVSSKLINVCRIFGLSHDYQETMRYLIFSCDYGANESTSSFPGSVYNTRRNLKTQLYLPSTLIRRENGAFRETLFKPEEFENAGFSFSCGKKKN